jgi:multidrug efflux pump subunit AcrA (membrane-fusion protein)
MKAMNRAWVKNAAIIFLAALLALTFFSNTILNRSLPEVSGQQAYGGEISTAVRVTGNVTANETWAVNIDASRQIKKILARVGDAVEAGQAIFELEPVDSAELKAAEKTLSDLRYSYNVALLGAAPADYRKDELDIERLRGALEDEREKLEKIKSFKPELDAAEARVEKASEDVNKVKDEIEALNDQIASIVVTVDPDLLTDEMKKYEQALAAATDYLSYAKNELTLAEQERSNALSGISGVPDTSALQTQLAQAKDFLNTTIVASVSVLETAFDDVYSVSGKTAGVDYPTGYAAYKAATGLQKSALLKTMLDGLATAYETESSEDNAMFTPAVINIVATYIGAKNSVASIEAQIANSGSYNTDYLNRQVELAQQRVNDAQVSKDSAQKRYDDATKDITVAGKKERQALEEKVSARTLAQKSLTRTETAAKEELAKIQEKAGLAASGGAAQTAEQAIKLAEEAVKTAERTLETRLIDFEISKDSAVSASAVKELDLARARAAVAEQEAEVERLRSKETGLEITTKYGGTVMSVSKVAGDTTAPGEPLAQIEINGKGFTLSKSVTNEEAQRVRIGDVANISSWGSSGITCTLTAIKTDRDNPSRNKVLEFDVEGDVTAGQQLELSVGTRTQYYENVVPNNAVREDSNGKFVLIARAKQTPLGTRYIATRADVEVINSDSKNSAISGTFDEWAPFVITQASKPVMENTQVRLVG